MRIAVVDDLAQDRAGLLGYLRRFYSSDAMFYRNSLGSGQQTVTLDEELVTVQSYLAILNTRYADQISGEYHIADGLREARILKLTIQPLVENAVHHGLRPKGGAGTIVISAEEDGGLLLLSVLDNGIGMSPEKLREIRRSTEEQTPGFGLFSIRRRIALFYGTSDPLTIESREGEWTKVTVQIPLERGDAHDGAEGRREPAGRMLAALHQYGGIM